jgi:ferrochelatase
MSDNPRFGFFAFAETWNGRLAMMGFVIGLSTEALTGQGILAQIGLG